MDQAGGHWGRHLLAMLAGLHLNVLWHQPSVLQAALAVYNLVIAYAFVRRRPAY